MRTVSTLSTPKSNIETDGKYSQFYHLFSRMISVVTYDLH